MKHRSIQRIINIREDSPSQVKCESVQSNLTSPDEDYQSVLLTKNERFEIFKNVPMKLTKRFIPKDDHRVDLFAHYFAEYLFHHIQTNSHIQS